MRVDWRTRRIAVAIAAPLFVVAVVLTSPTPANAHCPGTAANDKALGSQGLSFYVNGVTSAIGWTQGNVCTSGVSHSISVCSSGSCSHWAQAGWRYYSGYSGPRMYCEWAGGTYKLIEFSLSPGDHTYQQRFDSSGSEWDCLQDSSIKFSWPLASAGFTIGTYVVGQGENHQAHVQIGRVAPNKLPFWNMQYRKTSTGAWTTMNIVPRVTGGPYGADEPGVGQLRVWTNAH